MMMMMMIVILVIISIHISSIFLIYLLHRSSSSIYLYKYLSFSSISSSIYIIYLPNHTSHPSHLLPLYIYLSSFEGAFGKVLLVRHRLDKSLYAMKVISKKLLKKKNNIQYMKSERDILTKLRHPFIVTLHFAFKSDTKLFLVMDFLSKIM